MAGRLSINNVAQKVPAILECWYLGQECGQAVADVLFGDFNPGGKLPISIPRSVGATAGVLQPQAFRAPRFPVGRRDAAVSVRLRTELHDIRIEKRPAGEEENRPEDSTRVLVDVTNTGKRAGTEVVQMYIRDLVSSVTRPVKELKGFKKVELEPGQTQDGRARHHAGIAGVL